MVRATKKTASSRRKKGKGELPPSESKAEDLVEAGGERSNELAQVSDQEDGKKILADLEAGEVAPQAVLADKRNRESHEDDEDEAPEQVLLVRGRDEALKQKRLENDAVKRLDCHFW